jgi:hypothetical protein
MKQKKLLPRRLAFVKEYLRCRNASEAGRARSELPRSTQMTANGEVRVLDAIADLYQIGQHQWLFTDKPHVCMALSMERLAAMLEKAHGKNR